MRTAALATAYTAERGEDRTGPAKEGGEAIPAAEAGGVAAEAIRDVECGAARGVDHAGVSTPDHTESVRQDAT